MSQLGVGNQCAVNEHAGSDARSLRGDNDNASYAGACTKTDLCQAGCVGIVNDDGGPSQLSGESFLGVDANPFLVKVRHEGDHAVFDRCGERNADGHVVCNVKLVDQLLACGDDVVRGGRSRCGDCDGVAQDAPDLQVNE